MLDSLKYFLDLAITAPLVDFDSASWYSPGPGTDCFTLPLFSNGSSLPDPLDLNPPPMDAEATLVYLELRVDGVATEYSPGPGT